MVSSLTILVPQGAEYQAVCRGLKRSAIEASVLAIPAGLDPVRRWLEARSWETSRVWVLGLCGALNDRLGVGDGVCYERCLDASGRSWDCAVDPAWEWPRVTGLSSDRVVCRAETKRQLASQFQADVVDMEGAAILDFFAQRSIAVSIVRVVSDDAQGDIPDLSQAFDASGNLQAIPLALQMLRQPSAALRLIRGSLQGLKQLEQTTVSLMY